MGTFGAVPIWWLASFLVKGTLYGTRAGEYAAALQPVWLAALEFVAFGILVQEVTNFDSVETVRTEEGTYREHQSIFRWLNSGCVRV